MIKNKSGSHVGVVVSFVIFITFLFFLYSILEPVTSRERDKQYLLDYLKLSLIEDSTENFTTMTINIENPVGPQSCLNLQQMIGDDRIPEYMVNHLIFKTSEETFTYQRNDPNIRVNTGKNFVGLLKVYYSEEITPLPYDGVPGCSPKNYPIGFVKTYKEIFESKLEDLNDSYYADYEGLKAELGIPKGTEFSFYLLDGEKNIVFSAENGAPPETTSVYIEEVPIQYMDNQGSMSFGFLRIKVW